MESNKDEQDDDDDDDGDGGDGGIVGCIEEGIGRERERVVVQLLHHKI